MLALILSVACVPKHAKPVLPPDHMVEAAAPSDAAATSSEVTDTKPEDIIFLTNNFVLGTFDDRPAIAVATVYGSGTVQGQTIVTGVQVDDAIVFRLPDGGRYYSTYQAVIMRPDEIVGVMTFPDFDHDGFDDARIEVAVEPETKFIPVSLYGKGNVYFVNIERRLNCRGTACAELYPL